ncbi:MAG TPA: O-antigen ligase family protein [Stenomitos sp.]
MQLPQLIYIVGCSILILYWVSKVENKWFIFTILFWIFSLPILGDSRFTISLNFAGIDLQPNRILFLTLSAAFCFLIISARVRGTDLLDLKVHRFQLYELWMCFYILIAILTIIINTYDLGVRATIVTIVKLLTFLLVYFFSRECITSKDFQQLAHAIVFFAILSSLVGTYQFFGDAYFFRIGVLRPAFGSYIRANGFFTSEYDQGMFLTIAMVIGMLTIQNKWMRVLTITIIPLGTFFTMHRGSWLILIVALGGIVIREFRRMFPWVIAGGVTVVLALFITINLSAQGKNSTNFWNQLIDLRVTQNTWNSRISYNQFAIYMIQKYPLGIGAYMSDIYEREAYSKKLIDFVDGVPLVIHNGFLAAGVLHGITGMIVFVLFILSLLFHYLKKMSCSPNLRLMMILIIFSFVIINMTQDFSSIGDQPGIFIAILIGAALSLNSYIEKPVPESTSTQADGTI